ncbi:MAG: RNA polymerase sigma factor [Gammaproteobacteria bacterium]|nr:RNA polymerase sigma factor [Gammaproteobacteria bacterium]
MSIVDFWGARKDPHQQFELLLRPHLKQMYRLAYRLTGNREDAEDLVQDVMLKLFPKLDEMKAIEKLSPWLSRVLYRQFVDKYRQQQRQPLNLLDDDIEDEQLTELETVSGPEDVTNSGLTLELLSQAIAMLNEDQRQLILLHEVEGYSLPELQQMLDVPLGTLKSRLNRARGQLRESVKKWNLYEQSTVLNG